MKINKFIKNCWTLVGWTISSLRFSVTSKVAMLPFGDGWRDSNVKLCNLIISLAPPQSVAVGTPFTEIFLIYIWNFYLNK